MFEDKSKNKLYIGNLEYTTSEEEIAQAFSEKGINVKEVRIIKDKFSGRSKGFGFAEVESEDKIQEAISAMDGQDLKGRKIRVSQAKERQPRRDRGDNRDFRPRRPGPRSF
ncbi:MAG: RNA-binding protein [Candidatus Omnitrophica bacterium]|nr:RNA-binding protein [Candidatus Omnitrophota bacterium]